MPCLLLGRDRDDHRVAAPVIRDEFQLGQLLLDTLEIGVGFVDLVQRHHDRHARSLGMGDGFRVCGITPSSAATTSTTISAPWAPRARMA